MVAISLPRLAPIRRPKYDAGWCAVGSGDEDQRSLYAAHLPTLEEHKG
jgi:hypothetical protein